MHYIPTELRSPLLGGSAHRRRPMAHASFSKSYYCTVLPTIAFHFLPYTMRSTLTRSSHGFDRQSGRGSLPHLASLPIPSLGAGRPAVLLAPSTTLATTTMRRCGAPACLHHGRDWSDRERLHIFIERANARRTKSCRWRYLFGTPVVAQRKLGLPVDG